VLIYFDQDTKAAIFERMSRMIEPDGVLALGAAESVVGITDTFKPYPDRRGMYCPNTARAAPRGAARPAASSAMSLKLVAAAS
jgi:chemotaxis protein methyltransferase CheR